ncbi:MAG TPA: formate dehydrogenase [Ramlibacter sp.]|nr:formate dehydrogenase [Ramlibacter sp.]
MSQPKSKLSRRTLFAGAGTAGAVAAAATLLPGVVRQETSEPQEPKAPPAKGGGYQLTEHVKQYYKSTLV